jgi:hypothetical protein
MNSNTLQVYLDMANFPKDNHGKDIHGHATTPTVLFTIATASLLMNDFRTTWPIRNSVGTYM